MQQIRGVKGREGYIFLGEQVLQISQFVVQFRERVDVVLVVPCHFCICLVLLRQRLDHLVSSNEGYPAWDLQDSILVG